MNLFFVHDHIMRKKGEDYFSTGGLSKNVFERYINGNDKIYVYTRKKEVDLEKEEKLTKVNTDNIICVPSDTYFKPQDKYTKRRKINEEIDERLKNIDFCIIRLPSVLGDLVYKRVKKTNIPYVVEVVASSWDSLWNYGNIKGKIYAPFRHYSTKRQIKEAKNLIYVSEEFLQRIYPTKGKWIPCSNVNIEEPKEKNLEKRINKIRKNEDKIKVGMIGSLDVDYKGHKTAIKTLSKIKNKKIELHCLGPGKTERWKNLARKYNVEDQVFFDGTLPAGNPVLEWLDEIDVFLIPSLQEGLPRALVEAMSRGCPAIGVETGGIPELLEKEFVCKRKNYKQIAEKLKNLITNKKLMEEQAVRNFNVSKKYSKEILNLRRKNFLYTIMNKGEESCKER